MSTFAEDSKKQAEHLQSLGAKSTVYYDTFSESIFETFPNSSPDKNYVVTFTSSEVTSLCPKTSQPDFCTFKMEYIPDKVCIESKSLKQGLFALRNTAAFMESISAMLLDSFVNTLSPRGIKLTMDFAPRGGIGTLVVNTYVSPTLDKATKQEVCQKLGIPCVKE